MSVRAVSRRLLLSGPNRDLRGVAFFVLVPLALAFMTATATGYSRTLGYGGAILYVSLLSLVPWWIGEGTTRVVWILTRQHRPPLWHTCSLGVLLACVFVGPYVSFVTHVFAIYWPSSTAASETLSAHATHNTSENIVHIVRAIVLWTTANYIFDRLLDYPRFRNEEAKLAEPSCELEHIKPVREQPLHDAGSLGRPNCGLLQRLTRITSLADITVVKAEEHYILVYSEHDQELVAYRFGMAVKDLEDENGFQVHRSYWVRKSAVIAQHQSGSRVSLEMKDGETVPVSRPYHALIRQVF
ncbi:MAG: LytTR family DNA-binding domain-containing protein [Pseudomonadota bacterium]